MAAAVLLATACRGTVVSTPCGAYAEAYCEKQQACAGAGRITANWGDLSTCITRETLACTDGLDAPHTGQSEDLVQQCTSALPGVSCDDFLTSNLSSPCGPSGPLDIGAPCTVAAQCATGYCSDVRYGTCGTCAAPPEAGSSCATSSCARGLDCVWNTHVMHVCEAYVPSGSVCGAFQDPPCLPSVACAGASTTTGASGTCQPPVTTAGDPCGSANAHLNCDSNRGLWCLNEACIEVAYAADGMPCGYVGDGVVECAAGTCYSSAGPTFSYAGPRTGTCKAFAMDGAACDTAAGPGCMSPARCVTGDGGTRGVCTVPTAAVSAACGAGG